jgi:hypothetical protein
MVSRSDTAVGQSELRSKKRSSPLRDQRRAEGMMPIAVVGTPATEALDWPAVGSTARSTSAYRA